jgi:hypothetical protein
VCSESADPNGVQDTHSRQSQYQTSLTGGRRASGDKVLTGR